MKKLLHNSKIYKFGFTLAEVLITLVIIGVVAALTIPNLVNKTNKEELRTGLLKAQTSLSGALERYYALNGEKLIPANLSSRSLEPILKKYVLLSKDCGFANQHGSEVCAPVQDGLQNPYKTFSNGDNLYVPYLDDGQFIMNDGMTVLIENHAYCFLSVDVNGYNKKPNRAGYDLFMFQINENGNLVPMGAEGTVFYSASNQYCSASSSSPYNGYGCTAKALSEADYFKKLQ